MVKNRVREIRKSRGMTIAELAHKANISQPYLTRIETSERGLSIALAERLATALEAEFSEVIGLNGSSAGAHSAGANDVEIYTPQPGDLIADAVKKRPDLLVFRIKSRALDQINMHPGDVLFVDTSPSMIDKLEALQIVVANLFLGKDGKQISTLLRQYVPPSLLITNSTNQNSNALNTGTDDVAIKGIVVAAHKHLAGNNH